MSKKESGSGTDVFGDAITACLKKFGTATSVEIDPQKVQAFRATGGKFLRRYMTDDTTFAFDLMVAVDRNDTGVFTLSLPCTVTLTDEHVKASAPNLLRASRYFSPAAIVLSGHNRVTLVFNDNVPNATPDQITVLLTQRLTEGQRLATALKREIATVDGAGVFDPAKDRIWQSQMGKPVKLTPQELILAQGGASDGGFVGPIVDKITFGVPSTSAKLVQKALDFIPQVG